VSTLPSNTYYAIGDYSRVADDVADLVTAFAPEPSAAYIVAREAGRIAKPGGQVMIVARAADVSGRVDSIAQVLSESAGAPVTVTRTTMDALGVPGSYASGDNVVVFLVDVPP